MGLCNLIKTNSALALNTACAKALKSGTHRLIGDKAIQGDFDFAQTHPLIRELKVYGDFIHRL